MEEIWRNKNMKTIIKQSADGIVLSGDNNFDTTQGKVFINNHEITDIDTFFKVAEENTRLLEQAQKQKEVLDKVSSQIKLYGKYNGEKCTRGFSMMSADFNKLLDLLNEVSE